MNTIDYIDPVTAEVTQIPVPDDLTNSEAERLDACEQVIERGLATFVDVGMALLEVRDSRLYRAAYPTFEAYCAERWNLSPRHSNRLIQAAQVAENLGPMGPIPTNERQARELARLDPEAQREVWQAAVETAPNGQITAAHVRAVARINEALAAAPEAVQDVVRRFGVADADTINLFTDGYRAKRDWWDDIRATGYIQIGDEDEAVAATAGYATLRRAIDDKRRIHRQLIADERVQRRQQLADAAFSALRCELYHCDLGSAPVEPDSIDAIITDPPYGADYRELYVELARVAFSVLKAGGSLVVMTGQSDLPAVLNILSEHLDYQWVFAYLTPGGQSAQLWAQRVNTFWKPVIWLTKGPYTGGWKGDVLKSAVNDNDKTLHEWQQSISGMREIVTRFTEPNDVVFDPFMGSGTTGVVCAETARHFVGCDADARAVETARERLVAGA